LQRHAHLLGNRHEQIVEHFQHDRIGGGADRALPLERDSALEDEVVLRRDRGLPAFLQDDGLVRLDDDGGAIDPVARGDLRAQEDCRRAPCAAGIEPRCLLRPRQRRIGSANLAPPPIASIETASATSSLLSSMKPKRALWAASNADFICASETGSLAPPCIEKPGTTSAVSVPA
jgi:hypothetical protein